MSEADAKMRYSYTQVIHRLVVHVGTYVFEYALKLPIYTPLLCRVYMAHMIFLQGAYVRKIQLYLPM